MRILRPDEEAFTGLEAAIVLVAFVVVAAVFAYVVLGAGFMTTEKAQETVYSGVRQATAAVQQSGQTSIQADATGTGVDKVSFFLQLAASGTGTDMAAFGYTLSTTDKMTTYTADDVTYTWVKAVDGSGHTEHGGFLEPREMVLVTITTGFTAAELGLSDKFMIEVKPALGAPVTITGTVPGAMSASNWYDVY
jgi:flagellin FlaB